MVNVFVKTQNKRKVKYTTVDAQGRWQGGGWEQRRCLEELPVVTDVMFKIHTRVREYGGTGLWAVETRWFCFFLCFSVTLGFFKITKCMKNLAL